jgi:hypothetical protein
MVPHQERLPEAYSFTHPRAMPYYKRKKGRRSRAGNREVKLYLSVVVLCAVVAMALVLVIEVITEKVPTYVQQVEVDMLRKTAELATGRKLDDATLARLTKAYKSSEGDMARKAANWIRGKKLDDATLARLKKTYASREGKRR